MCSKNTVIAISTIKCLDKAVLQNITGGGGGGGGGGVLLTWINYNLS